MIRNLLLIIVLLFAINSYSQDPHFSQFYGTPQIVNPSLNGLYTGTGRISVQYKNQWGEFIDKAYNTGAVSYDAKQFFKAGCDYMNLGVNLIYDRSGDLGWTSFFFNTSASYYKSLNSIGTQYIALGFTAGFAQRHISVDPVEDFLDEPEVIPNESYHFYDLGAGILWYAYPNKRSYFYIGLAAYHLNNPEQSFYASSYGLLGTEELLYQKYVGHMGMELVTNDNVSWQPSFLIYTQGPHTEFNIGSFLKYQFGNFADYDRTAIYIGGWYRVKDAMIATVRLDHKSTYYAFSYDVNVSSFQPASRGRGGLELSITRVLNNKKKKRYCPDPVDCPKL